MHYKYVSDYWKDGNITCMAIILTLYGNYIDTLWNAIVGGVIFLFILWNIQIFSFVSVFYIFLLFFFILTYFSLLDLTIHVHVVWLTCKILLYFQHVTRVSCPGLFNTSPFDLCLILGIFLVVLILGFFLAVHLRSVPHVKYVGMPLLAWNSSPLSILVRIWIQINMISKILIQWWHSAMAFDRMDV